MRGAEPQPEGSTLSSVVARWEGRGAVARYGTRRGVLWSLFIAVAFFELTNPTHLVPDFPGAMGVLAVVTGLILILDRRNVRLPRVPWTIIAYLALCALSVFWSIDRSDTLQMTLLYAWIALFACICVAQPDIQTYLRGVAWGGAVVVVVTLLSVVVDPKRFGSGLLFPGTGPGVHGTKGIVAYSVVLALTAALMRRPLTRRSWIDICLTLALNAVGIAIASASTGRMGVVAVLVAWALLQVLRRLHGRTLARAWAGVAALVLLAGTVAVIARDRVTQLLGERADFNGRFEIWHAVIGGWLQAPITGYGFGAVWNYGWWRLDGSSVLDQMNKVAKIEFFHGHNIFLDILAQLGLLGLAASLLILGLIVVRGTTRLADASEGPAWALLVFVAVLVMGIAEPMLSVPIGWFSLTAATAAARSRRRHASPAEPGPLVGAG